MAIYGRANVHGNYISEREFRLGGNFTITPIEIKNATLQSPEAVAQRCSVKKVFLEIPQNSRENNCARVSFLIKLQASG